MSKPRILVVDDEFDVLKLIAEALALWGYEVNAVPTPRQALELVRTMPSFDLVLSDFIMPEMCGPELVRKITEISPATSVVMMSGNTYSQDLPKGAFFLGKPFLLVELQSILEKALNHGSAATGA